MGSEGGGLESNKGHGGIDGKSHRFWGVIMRACVYRELSGLVLMRGFCVNVSSKEGWESRVALSQLKAPGVKESSSGGHSGDV